MKEKEVPEEMFKERRMKLYDKVIEGENFDEEKLYIEEALFENGDVDTVEDEHYIKLEKVVEHLFDFSKSHKEEINKLIKKHEEEIKKLFDEIEKPANSLLMKKGDEYRVNADNYTRVIHEEEYQKLKTEIKTR